MSEASSETPVETTYAVCVQQSMRDMVVDTFPIKDGFTPDVDITDDRELWINQVTDEPDQDDQLVVVYAQGTWLCAWVVENPEYGEDTDAPS